MSQYVYALHDFDPENPDEVPFRAGERIEVIERDDEFGDGWWQGRNLSGKTGLFPVSYTTPAPPSNDTATSQSLPHIQEPDHEQEHEPTFDRQNSYDSASGLRSPTALEAIHEHDETTANNSPSPHHLSPQPVQAAPEPQRFDSDVSLYPESLRDRLHDEPAEEAQPSPEIPDSQSTAGRSVMRATLTDVQQAIEQLGRRGTFMDDGGRSFSFASSRSVTSETEDDREDEDDGFGTEYGDDDDQGWHKDARTKLAEKARRAAAREQKEREREKARATLGNGGGLSLAPPIEVELSDESEPEEGEDDTRHPAGPPGSGYHAGSTFLPRNPTISEEGPFRAESPTELVEPGTARANQATFEPMPSLYPHPEDPRARRVSQIYPEAEEEELQGPPTPVSPPAVLPVAEPAPRPVTELIFVPVPKTSPTSPAEPAPPVVQVPKTPEPPKPAPIADVQARDIAQAFPSPVSSAFQSTKPAPPLSPAPLIAPVTPPPPTSSTSHPGSAGGGDLSSSQTHPSEWTVDQVVEWLRSKGFDDSVCNTFIEQEVTGDVLLEIDQAVLKTEFGIAAFGKRVRIANAISDLKRPASFSYSDAGQAFPGIGQQQQQFQQQQHLGRPDPINVPGPGVGQMGAMATPVSHHSSGMQSLRSESPGPSGMRAAPSMAPTDMGSLIPQSATTSAGGGATHFHRRNMSDVSGSVASSVRWMDGSTVGTTVEGQTTGEGGYGGIGLGLAPTQKMGLAPPGRANQLAASPSEGALSQRALGEASIAEEAEDGRAALSESEAAPKEKSKRRQFFGRSLESTMEKDKESLADVAPSPRSAKSGSARSDGGAAAATETGSVRSRHSKKRSIDVEKKDRLSIFGGISGISGKTRKPAPRYSAALDNADIPGNGGTPEKQHSNRLLSSLYPSSTSKRSVSARPSTANSTNKDSPSNSPVDARTAYADSAPRGRDPALLRKRTTSQNEVPRVGPDNEGLLSSDAGPGNALKPGQSILEQIGTPDHEGWMRKKSERYNSWKVRFFVLKGPHLYVMKSNSRAETKIKGYMHIAGYKVVADENIDPGRYGFRLVHEHDKEHYFSSEEKGIVREWMKALIKATITRDYQKPVISSVNIPTIPLTVAQTMNPAPRPPSPGARDATQRATRRDNPNQLSTRDAQILMGIPGQDKNGAIVPPQGDRRTLPPAFREETAMQSPSNSAYGSVPPSRSAPTPLSPRPSVSGPAPPRPSREQRRLSSSQNANPAMLDMGLVEWANPYLPQHLRINSLNDGVYGGLALLRLAEAIKGKPASPPVPDSAFPANPSDEKLDGLFQLFDYLLDNDVKVGAVSINDIRQGRRDKVIQILRALKQWEDKRRAIAMGISQASPVGFAGPMMAGGAWGGGM